MKIVFATNNLHKLDEIRKILGESFEIVSLKDIGCDVDIPETGTTLDENAHLKAKYVYDHYGLDCFADDTGLEVEALGGAPGVHSARYAEQDDHNSEANMAKLLASAMTLYSFPTAMPRALLNLEGQSRTKSATEQGPWSS